MGGAQAALQAAAKQLAARAGAAAIGMNVPGKAAVQSAWAGSGNFNSFAVKPQNPTPRENARLFQMLKARRS